jgi:hypothetical protein
LEVCYESRAGLGDGALGRDFGGGGWIEVESLEALEVAEGVAEVALGGIDYALEAGEGAVHEPEGMADGGVLVELHCGVHLIDIDLGFGGGQAAEGPGGADQDIDQIAPLGKSGVEALEVLFGEGGELLGIFTGNGEGFWSRCRISGHSWKSGPCPRRSAGPWTG